MCLFSVDIYCKSIAIFIYNIFVMYIYIYIQVFGFHVKLGLTRQPA